MSDAKVWAGTIEHVIKAHMVHLAAPVLSSTGPTVEYFDGIGAIICSDCRADVLNWYNAQIEHLWPVATGASGAALLGLLGRGTYIQPPWKATGPVIRPPKIGGGYARIALVDDCAFTGSTMDRLVQAVARHQLGTIVKGVVMFDKRPAPK